MENTKAASLPAVRRLNFSAPNREWGADGVDRPWSEAGVREACGGGAWFKGTEHFESEATRTVAMRLSRGRQA